MMRTAARRLSILSRSEESESEVGPVRRPKSHVDGKLWIKVVQARNLVARDLSLAGKSSDPYVVISCMGHRLTTSTIRKSLSPVWNEEFSIEITDFNSELNFVVMDEDEWKFDDFLGRVKVYLRDIPVSMDDGSWLGMNENHDDSGARKMSPKNVLDAWFKLRPRRWKEVVTGELHIQLRYFRRPHQMQKSIMGGLANVLSDPIASEFFMKFLIDDYSEENLLFWKDVDEFKRQMRAHSPVFTANGEYSEIDDLLRMQRKIYLEFIEDGAKHEVNLDSNSKKKLVKAFRSSSKLVDPDELELLENCQVEVFKNMDSDIFPRFLKSNLYAEMSRMTDWVSSFKNFAPERKVESLQMLVRNLGKSEIQILTSLLSKQRELECVGTGMGFPRAVAVADHRPEPDETETGSRQNGRRTSRRCDLQLGVSKGDILSIIRADDLSGWYWCENSDGERGYVPSICLFLTQDSEKQQSSVRQSPRLSNSNRLSNVDDVMGSQQFDIFSMDNSSVRPTFLEGGGSSTFLVNRRSRSPSPRNAQSGMPVSSALNMICNPSPRLQERRFCVSVAPLNESAEADPTHVESQQQMAGFMQSDRDPPPIETPQPQQQQQLNNEDSDERTMQSEFPQDNSDHGQQAQTGSTTVTTAETTEEFSVRDSIESNSNSSNNSGSSRSPSESSPCIEAEGKSSPVLGSTSRSAETAEEAEEFEKRPSFTRRHTITGSKLNQLLSFWEKVPSGEARPSTSPTKPAMQFTIPPKQ